MKTSFYFVLWFAIYPILDLIGIHSENSFIIALIVIFGLSWILNRHLVNFIRYDAIRQTVNIGELAYTGRLAALRKKITTLMWVNIITSVYLIATSMAILATVLHGATDQILTLVLFLFFGFGTLPAVNRMRKARALILNPETADESLRLAFNIDYPAYLDQRRMVSTPDQLLPPRPQRYPAYVAVNVIFSVLCVIFGVVYLVMGLLVMAGSGTPFFSFMLLYGGLAFYFGIRDTAASLASLKANR